jgi:DNA-binding NtrC family response regulator
MSSNPFKILVIEDDSLELALFEKLLSQRDYRVTTARTMEEGKKIVLQKPFDLVITDFHLPGSSGLDFIREIHPLHPQLPIILMTADGTVELAIEATKSGAFDYLLKPFDPPTFLETVEKALKASRFMHEKVAIGENASSISGPVMLGRCRAMQEIYKEIGRVSALPVTVLIRGETGTGKELIARAIYQHSDRNDRPFIAVNCAAIPETLLEAELFGAEKGAYTGAHARRIGRFEQAQGGTIFLDEVGEISLSTQAKLLRVLQERKLQRIGGNEEIPIDVRLIAATNRHLEKAIEERLFREDLFYRLNVVVLRVPTLRDRREDIPQIARHFLKRYAQEFSIPSPSISEKSIEFLQDQAWPGNIRQLENTIRKALLEARNFTIQPEHLHLQGDEPQTPATAVPAPSLIDSHLRRLREIPEGKLYEEVIAATEKELFTKILEKTKGNQTKASRLLGISRLTLRQKLIQYQIHPKSTSDESDLG